MEYYNNILGIEANWLIVEGIMTKCNYDQLNARKDIQVIRRACRNTPALVSYESLPMRFKREVDAKVNIYKVVQVNEVEAKIEHNATISAYYESYTLSDGRKLPMDKRHVYYTNAIILEAVAQLISERKLRSRARNKSYKRGWDSIADAIEQLDPVRYPHTLPSNPRSLERKFQAYQSDGAESLIHKSYITQQRNAAKIQDEVQESAIAMLVSDPRNLDDMQVMRLYNMLAEQMQWLQISRSTVANYREKMQNNIYARRHGAAAYANNKAMQVKRVAPDTALTYWVMDGWDVELMYQKFANGKTTFHNRLTCVFIIDACCKYPIGYAIGERESPALIKEALRNAALHTEQLFGQMYRTMQLQSDRYQIKNMMPVYDIAADKVTPAAVGNAKSKVIERWFKYFNKKYCQMLPNWSGFGVTSRKELQPNVQFLNKHRHEFPDLLGVIKQIETAIHHERTELYDQYMEAYAATPDERKLLLPYDQYLMCYGATTGHKNLLQGSGLKVTIEGIKHDYDCFDLEFRDYSTTRWEVRYDPDDKRKVLAVNEDGTRQFMLEEKYVQPMALADRQEGDYEQLQRVWDYNHQQSERIAQRIGEQSDNVSALLENRRELDTLQKLLLVDSTGQHKDRRNDARLNKKSKKKPEIFDVTPEDDDIYSDY